MFGLALLLTSVSYRNFQTFLAFLNISCAFMVWSGLIDLWVLILTTIILIFVIANSLFNNRGNF